MSTRPNLIVMMADSTWLFNRLARLFSSVFLLMHKLRITVIVTQTIFIKNIITRYTCIFSTAFFFTGSSSDQTIPFRSVNGFSRYFFSKLSYRVREFAKKYKRRIIYHVVVRAVHGEVIVSRFGFCVEAIFHLPFAMNIKVYAVGTNEPLFT